MEIDVNKENVCINKLICEKKELIFVEEDMIVPDSKPDILNTINLTGNVCIYKNEAMDEKVKVEGSVNTYIMYLPDSQNDILRGLNANINFSQMIGVSESREGMNCITNVVVKSLECKVLNGRKINVRAGLEVNIKLYDNEDIEIISGINNIEGIQTLEKSLTINSLVGSGSTRVYVKDTLNIDDQDEILEILKSEINLVDNDIKISYNKVLSKCEAEVKIMYLTQDNRINTVQGRIPAVGFIDIQNVSEENTCDVKNEIKNILIRPNPAEEHSVYVEIELESMCMCYEKKEITTIQDMYSPTTDLSFTEKRVTTTSEKLVRTKNFTVTSKTNIPDLSDGSLLDVEIMSSINKEQKTTSKIIYEGELSLNFIFIQGSSTVNSKISKIPFDFSIDNPFMSEQVNVDTTDSIINKNFVVKPNGDVECSIDMEFIAEFYENIGINLIDNVQVNEMSRSTSDDYDSLIIYIVQPGDSLWKIAKRFKSTVEEIAVTNGIEDRDKINVGQKLYIPKFNYTSRV